MQPQMIGFQNGRTGSQSRRDEDKKADPVLQKQQEKRRTSEASLLRALIMAAQKNAVVIRTIPSDRLRPTDVVFVSTMNSVRLTKSRRTEPGSRRPDDDASEYCGPRPALCRLATIFRNVYLAKPEVSSIVMKRLTGKF
jgi:hypothetical protein